MIDIGLTGHTRGLGSIIYKILTEKKYQVSGFSLSNGYDLRDYSQVGIVLDKVKNFDWVINCAKPDYVQTQILYRLVASDFSGNVLNIGSPVVHRDTGWKDLSLLEYVTQKTALYHAHTSLSRLYSNRLFMWEPAHTTNVEYVSQSLKEFGL